MTPKTKPEKKKGIDATPYVYRVIMEKNGVYYRAMPVKGYEKLFPGKWKCGKCLKGVIRPLIGLYDAPKCKVCGAFVRDITYNDNWHPHFWTNKTFRYSFEPI